MIKLNLFGRGLGLQIAIMVACQMVGLNEHYVCHTDANVESLGIYIVWL